MLSTTAVRSVRRRTGRRGENSHKAQCKRLVEIKARYVEKTKKEIEEKMAEFGER